MGDAWTVAILDPAFRARMNPRCSWLDRELGRSERRYALEHEQVHFALLELEARRLNDELRALRIDIESPDDAAARAKEAVDRLLDAAKQRYLEASRRFDAEASHPSKQAAQTRWLERSRERLETFPASN